MVLWISFHHDSPCSYITWGTNNRPLVRFQVLTAASMKFRVFWGVAPCNHVEVYLMMAAVHTSETSVNFNVTTRRYIPEDTKFQQAP
jgi:hypothetical protein